MEREARREEKPIQRIPSKLVFTVKVDGRYKTRLVGCDNFGLEALGITTTAELDGVLLRYMLSWHAGRRGSKNMSQETVAQLDISNAFINSELPDSRLVLITPPSILVTLGFVDKKMIWASTRNQGLRSLKLQGEYEIYQLETHESLWAVVRAKSVGQRDGAT